MGDIIQTLTRRLLAQVDASHGRYPKSMAVSEDELEAISREMWRFQKSLGLPVITEGPEGTLLLHDFEQPIYHNLKFRNVTLKLAHAG